MSQRLWVILVLFTFILAACGGDSGSGGGGDSYSPFSYEQIAAVETSESLTGSWILVGESRLTETSIDSVVIQDSNERNLIQIKQLAGNAMQISGLLGGFFDGKTISLQNGQYRYQDEILSISLTFNANKEVVYSLSLNDQSGLDQLQGSISLRGKKVPQDSIQASSLVINSAQFGQNKTLTATQFDMLSYQYSQANDGFIVQQDNIKFTYPDYHALSIEAVDRNMQNELTLSLSNAGGTSTIESTDPNIDGIKFEAQADAVILVYTDTAEDRVYQSDFTNILIKLDGVTAEDFSNLSGRFIFNNNNIESSFNGNSTDATANVDVNVVFNTN